MRTRRWPPTVLAVLALCAVAGCARPAAPATPAAVPGPLRGALLATDPARGDVLAYLPGRTVWEWTGARWLRRLPATVPPARDNAVLVADPATRRVLLIGGAAPVPAPSTSPGTDGHAGVGTARPSRFRVDAWSFHGDDWHRVTGYAAQVSGHAGYDRTRRAVVLVGTVSATTSTTTFRPTAPATWEWTGDAWRRLGDAPPDQITGLGYDPATGQTLALAAQDPFTPGPGMGAPSRIGFAHLWRLDGRTWRQDTSPNIPPAGATLAQDPVTGAALLISHTGATFEYRDRTWTRLRPHHELPAHREATTQAAASRSRTLLLVSDAHGDRAWAWNGHDWRPAGIP